MAVLAARTAGADVLHLDLFIVSQPGASILSYHSREQAQADLRRFTRNSTPAY